MAIVHAADCFHNRTSLSHTFGVTDRSIHRSLSRRFFSAASVILVRHPVGARMLRLDHFLHDIPKIAALRTFIDVLGEDCQLSYNVSGLIQKCPLKSSLETCQVALVDGDAERGVHRSSPLVLRPDLLQNLVECKSGRLMQGVAEGFRCDLAVMECWLHRQSTVDFFAGKAWIQFNFNHGSKP